MPIHSTSSPALIDISAVPSFATAVEAVELLQRGGFRLTRAGIEDRRRVVAVIWGDRPFRLAEASHYPALRVLARFGVGVDAVAVEDLLQLGIRVETTPGVSTDSVAEFAMAMIILALRRAGPHVHGLRTDPEQWRPESRGHELISSSTVGIVGCGRIGLQTARLLARWGVRVILWNRTWPPDPNRGRVPDGAVRTGRLQDLVQSDVLSVHLALDSETRGFLGEPFFRAVEGAGRQIALVNTARSGIIDEDALLAALERGTVTSAALDVWPVEGSEPSHGTGRILRRHPRVLPTPHIAAYTEEAFTKCALACAHRILAVLVPPDASGRSAGSPRRR